MRVAILPTGRMEWDALPMALSGLFAGHHFYSLPTNAQMLSPGQEFPIPSFTSCDVLQRCGRSCNADKLVQLAVAEAIGDRKREAADLVVILDDLEIVNLYQPQAVIEIMREAAQRFLISQHSPIRERHERALSERVSFHLAKPMIEAWLFADPMGPIRAGMPHQKRPQLLAGTDPECFVTVDAAYDADTGSQCMVWNALPYRKNKKCTPAWLRADPNRMLHPKAYIAWLCMDTNKNNCTAYAESQGGAEALSHLDWHAVLGVNNHCGFVRAMIDDIAHALGLGPPFPGCCAPETDLSTSRPGQLFRNI